MGAKTFWSNSSSDLRDCRLFISTKCAGMGREGKLHTRYPADCLHFFYIFYRCQEFPRTSGSSPRC